MWVAGGGREQGGAPSLLTALKTSPLGQPVSRCPSTALSTFCPKLLPRAGRSAPLAGSGQRVLTWKQTLRGLSRVFGDEATPGALKAPCELEPSLPHPSHMVPPRGQRLSFRGFGWTST